MSVSKRKGISLPIEMIVVIAIAVLVLVVIVAFFVGSAGGQFNTITDQDALARGCTNLAMQGCDKVQLSAVPISSYSGTCGTLTGNSLQVACCKAGYTIYDYSNPASCQVMACRCPAK